MFLLFQGEHFGRFQKVSFQGVIHPQSLTWNLKMMVSKRNLLFQGLIFRFHVKLPGCISSYNQKIALTFSEASLRDFPGQDFPGLKVSHLGSISWAKRGLDQRLEKQLLTEPNKMRAQLKVLADIFVVERIS